MGFGVPIAGFGGLDSGFEVGFRVRGLGFEVGFRVRGLGFWVRGLILGVLGGGGEGVVGCVRDDTGCSTTARPTNPEP